MQGTGDSLFLLQISCIAREVSPELSVSSYVNVTRVTMCMVTQSTDCAALQQDLQAVYKWEEDVNMIFHGDKF